MNPNFCTPDNLGGILEGWFEVRLYNQMNIKECQVSSPGTWINLKFPIWVIYVQEGFPMFSWEQPSASGFLLLWWTTALPSPCSRSSFQVTSHTVFFNSKSDGTSSFPEKIIHAAGQTEPQASSSLTMKFGLTMDGREIQDRAKKKEREKRVAYKVNTHTFW